MVTACESFPSNSLSSSPNIIFSFICIWRSCQANICGLCLAAESQGTVKPFPWYQHFLPSTDFPHIGLGILPQWQIQWRLMHLLMTLKHEVFTTSLYNTQGISGTSRCLCKCDLRQDEYNAYQFPYNKIICCTIGRQLLLHYHSMIRK